MHANNYLGWSPLQVPYVDASFHALLSIAMVVPCITIPCGAPSFSKNTHATSWLEVVHTRLQWSILRTQHRQQSAALTESQFQILVGTTFSHPWSIKELEPLNLINLPVFQVQYQKDLLGGWNCRPLFPCDSLYNSGLTQQSQPFHRIPAMIPHDPMVSSMTFIKIRALSRWEGVKYQG